MAKRPQVSDSLFNSLTDAARLMENPEVAWEDAKALFHAILLKHGWRAPRSTR